MLRTVASSLVGVSKPQSILINVVFPALFSPNSAKNSPSLTENASESTTV